LEECGGLWKESVENICGKNVWKKTYGTMFTHLGVAKIMMNDHGKITLPRRGRGSGR